ncbi:MAG: AraC family transcriptional regulator [Treponema sp.]|nr:AraC family transcriptional regulator [Treponema sp.]
MRPVRNLILFFTVLTAIVTIFLSLMFAWQSTKPMQSFLDTLDSTRIIRPEYERFKKKLSLSPFKSFRQMFNDIGERISLADKELENSLHIIKHETQILRMGMVDKIQEALESGNDAAACTILQETASALPEPEDPQISGLIANLLEDMHEKLKKKFPDILADLEFPGYNIGNQNVYFDRVLPEYFRKIDELLRVHREREITKFDRSVLDFINEHLYDSELYITMVSDRFKISAPSIQKLVKKVSGQTFLVYVENLRLSRACEILSTTGHTVTETAALCGFSNANSFSRAFKRVYGFSPSRILNGNIQSSSVH